MTQTCDNLAQQLKSLGGSIRLLQRQAGDVAARSRQRLNHAGADRVSHRREHDRNDRRRVLCCERLRGSGRDDDIDFESDQLGGDLRQTLKALVWPTVLDGDGAALDPTEFAQPLHEGEEALALN
jgi:hypothetical protein